MKQALVKQGIYREQESSHHEWADHTLRKLTLQRLFLKKKKKKKVISWERGEGVEVLESVKESILTVVAMATSTGNPCGTDSF